MPALLKLRCLGTLTITLDDQPLARLKSKKARALLVYLAVSRQRCSRSALATLFWPDIPETKARMNLRKEISHLRRLLAPYIEIERDSLAMNGSVSVWLDIAELEQESGAGAAAKLRRAVDLYKGDFLHGFYVLNAPLFDEWVQGQRARCQDLHLQALNQLAMLAIDSGQLEMAIQYTQRLLLNEPWRETAHRQLIRLYLLTGQRDQAITQFERCRLALADALGLEPAAETRRLLQNETGRSPLHGSHTARQLFGNVPGARPLHGRENELLRLTNWLLDRRCRLVSILGLGGQGKTALAAKVARSLAEQQSTSWSGTEAGAPFKTIIWYSLKNAPALSDLLRYIQGHIASRPEVDVSLSAAFWDQLFADLSQERCLIILDNLETILSDAGTPGQFSPGFTDYAELLRQFVWRDHQSCLLFTSRERPAGFRQLAQQHARVRALPLAGLSADAGHKILADHHVAGAPAALNNVVARYSGNPLALHLIAETIQEYYSRDLSAFLQGEAPLFADIQAVLDQQFARLTELEKELLYWLAIEREPVTIEALWQNFAHKRAKRAFLEALHALQRRSLLETVDAVPAKGFTLQNIIMEYVLDCFLAELGGELVTLAESLNAAYDPPQLGQAPFKLLGSHALLKAQAKDFVRQSQTKLILDPLIAYLEAKLGPARLQPFLRDLVTALRRQPLPRPDYAAGNILNLLLHLGHDPAGLDFSGLAVWGAYLQGRELGDVNLAGADLTGSVFTDPFGAIISVAVSPDGVMLAVGTDDGAIWLRRVTDGQPLAVLQGHDDAVWSVAFAPDGRTLASASSDKTIRLWSPSSAQHLATYTGHANTIWSVAFTPDGETLVSGSFDRTVRLWDIPSGAAGPVLAGHENSVSSVAVSPDGQTIASSSGDYTIRLWERQSGHYLRRLHGHTDWVGPVCFAPDGTLLASCSYDTTIRLWAVATGELQRTFCGHTERISALAMSPDGRLLASGGADQTIRIWDMATGACHHTLLGHANYVDCLVFTPDGETLISGGYDQTIRLWDVATGQPLRKIQGRNMTIMSVAFSPDGATLASGGYDEKVSFWDPATGRQAGQLSGHRNWIWAIAYNHDGSLLASASYDKTICLWEPGSGRLLGRLAGHEGWVVALAFSRDGRTLISGGLDRKIRFWDVPGGLPRREPLDTEELVWNLALSPDGTLLAGGGYDHDIRVWEVATGRLVEKLTGHASFAWTVAFHPDGRRLASGSYDSAVKLWDVTSGHVLHTLNGHTNWVETVTFDPSGQLLASGGHDHTVRLWDVASGRLVRILDGHEKMVAGVAFSPDGQILASCGGDETIRLWDVASGVCQRVLRARLLYAGLNITGVTGLTASQKAALLSLGAVEDRKLAATG